MTLEKLYEISLKRLARRERSLSEMRTYLASKLGSDEEDPGSSELIEQVLQKLVSLRYLDEERMANALIREQRLQSRGPRSAWLKLKSKGIAGWSLERVELAWRSGDVISINSENEVETARRWALRRYRGLFSGDNRKERQRALAALVRRGYSFSIARQALELSEPADRDSDSET